MPRFQATRQRMTNEGRCRLAANTYFSSGNIIFVTVLSLPALQLPFSRGIVLKKSEAKINPRARLFGETVWAVLFLIAPPFEVLFP
jgi:hypothetical protein